MSDVVLRYRRNQFVYTGDIYLDDKEEGKFANFPFRDVMLMASEVLVENPDAGFVLYRTERPGLQPYRMSDVEVEQLRERPEEAIESMSPKTITIDTRGAAPIHSKAKVNLKEPTKEEMQKVADSIGIPTGHDVLADAFGDEIYLQRKDNKVECPCCGRWMARVSSGPLKSVTCDCRAMVIPLEEEEASLERWIPVKVCEILFHQADRYFLPRAWNKPGPWITHEELKKKYVEFTKEKEDVRKSNGS